MTNVAIYARYSSDKQREASIEDQIRNCQTYAEREGWDGEPTIYGDKAISGTKKDRPEYQRMLADAQAGAFSVLLVDDLSRLSRNNAETLSVLERLIFWQIRVVGISDGYDSDSEAHEVVSGTRGIVNSIYLSDLRKKTQRGLIGKALAGHNTGGRAYGYRHVPIEDQSRKDQFGRPVVVAVRREVDPEQADVVRRIFKEFAEGRGYREIASRLNDAGIKPLRREAWGGSTIRSMLRNQVYVGRLIYNQSEWVRDPETNCRRRRQRPEDEWVVQDAPELRMVSDDLWEQVERRRQDLEGKHKARIADGKKRPGKVPQHLFTGLLNCGQCGGKYIVANRTHVLCANRANRRQDDKAHCDAPSVRKDVLESKLLHAIKTELFDAKSFEAFKTEVRRALADRLKSRNQDAATIKRDLAKAEKELENVTAAIVAAGHSDALLAQLKTLEAKQKDLQAKLDADLPPALANIENLLEDALSRYARVAYSLEDFSSRDVTKARNLIRALVGGEIVLQPTDAGGLTAQLTGDYGGLIELVKEASPRTERNKSRMVAGARNHLYRTKFLWKKRSPEGLSVIPCPP